MLVADAYDSDITDESYCSRECREKAEQEHKERHWFYSEYDNEYFEEKEDVTSFMEYDPERGEYQERTISKESLNGLHPYTYEGISYDEINELTNLPYGMRLAKIEKETETIGKPSIGETITETIIETITETINETIKIKEEEYELA